MTELICDGVHAVRLSEAIYGDLMTYFLERFSREELMERGIILNDIVPSKLDGIVEEMRVHFEKIFHKASLRLQLWRAYLVRYSDSHHPLIPPHVDFDCDVTLNLHLGTEFEGGDLYFLDKVDRHVIKEYKHVKGVALFHSADMLHGTRAVTSGERYNIIFKLRWMDPRFNRSFRQFQVLDDAMKIKIMRMLRPEEAIKIGSCSKQMKDLSRCDALWQGYYREYQEKCAYIEVESDESRWYEKFKEETKRLSRNNDLDHDDDGCSASNSLPKTGIYNEASGDDDDDSPVLAIPARIMRVRTGIYNFNEEYYDDDARNEFLGGNYNPKYRPGAGPPEDDDDNTAAAAAAAATSTSKSKTKFFNIHFT